MQHPTRPQTSALRVQAATSAVNTPDNCPSCGGIFMLQLSAQMFTPAGSGYRGVSTSPQSLFLCLCGEILMPKGYASGVPAGGEKDFFVQSVRMAIARRQSLSLDQVAQSTPSLAEFEALKAKHNELVQRFNALLRAETVAPVAVEDQTEEESGLEDVIGATTVPEPASPPEEMLLVPSGNRGRSSASAGDTPGPEGSRLVEANGRPAYGKGGAATRLKRQGA